MADVGADGFIVPPPGILAPREDSHEDSSTVEHRPSVRIPTVPFPAGKPPFATGQPATPADAQTIERPPGAAPATEEPAAPTAPTATVSAPRRWMLQFDDGQSIPVAGTLVIGRNPTADSEHPAAATISVTDPRRSVSKTHAAVELDGDALVVTDLHSTNGVSVGDVYLEAGLPFRLDTDTIFHLGEFAVRAIVSAPVQR